MLSVCCVSPCELVFPSMCELVFLRGECKWEHIVGEEASWLPRPQTQHNALSYLKRKAKKMTESGRVEFLIYLQICAFPTPTSQYVGFSCLCWNWVELRLGIVLFFKLLFCGWVLVMDILRGGQKSLSAIPTQIQTFASVRILKSAIEHHTQLWCLCPISTSSWCLEWLGENPKRFFGFVKIPRSRSSLGEKLIQFTNIFTKSSIFSLDRVYWKTRKTCEEYPRSFTRWSWHKNK